MTNWDAVKTGSLDALMAAIMERMSDQRDDPSSREQEYADTSLSLIERCKAAERALAESEARLAESEARRAEAEAERARAGARADVNLERAEAAERSLAAAVEVLRQAHPVYCRHTCPVEMSTGTVRHNETCCALASVLGGGR